MTSSRVPAAGVDVVGEPKSAPLSDAVSGDRATAIASFGEARQPPPLPGDGRSDPAAQLTTRAGDIHVELTVGDGDIEPASATVDEQEERTRASSERTGEDG